ncbi:MAG: type II secretion system protein [Candidatus Omnitrophota bacterium]
MKKGFTIIEILIVIAVIGILAGLALPRFRGMQDEANIAKSNRELKTVQAALESYAMHNSGNYPANLSVLAASTTVPRIISSVPSDPFAAAGTDYGYSLSSNGEYYVLWSAGVNGGGTASVSDDGAATVSNSPYITNARTISVSSGGSSGGTSTGDSGGDDSGGTVTPPSSGCG